MFIVYFIPNMFTVYFTLNMFIVYFTLDMFSQVPSIEDKVQEALQCLDGKGSGGLGEDQLKDFKKRKLITNM